MEAFFLTIVNMSISASWIVLAVLLLRLLLKKAPKWIMVLLWGIVAIRLICPFTIESVLSLMPNKEAINPGILVEQGPVVSPDLPVIDGAQTPGISGTDTPVMGEPVAPVPNTTPANPVQTAIAVFSYVWLVGIAGMLAYTVISYFRVKGRVGTAVRLRDNIFQSEWVVSPFVLGLIKPKIYLPFCIDGQDMEYVIAHENAHIRRKDHWWKPVGFLILTLHWFNPLLWLGYVLLCRDIELACDEKVIKSLDYQQKADYSLALLNCSVNRRILAACPLAFGEIGVKDRVKSVLNYKKPAFWIIVVAIVASIAVAVCFLTDPVDKKTDDPTQQTNATEPTNNGGQQTYPAVTFRVNSAYPEYTAIANYSNEAPESVTITESASQKQIQTISLTGNELFAPSVIYAVDITFDGNMDILIPYQNPASGVYFQAYVWRETEKQFVYAPQFENIANFILDRTNGRILSTRTASQITSYSVHYYNAEAKDFRSSHSLYWEPGTGNQIHFVEQQYKNGAMITVKDCLVESTSATELNRSDPQIAEYFVSGSFWDLDNQKWKDPFYKPGVTQVTKSPAEAYADFLNGYVTDTSVLYFTKDIDGNGTEELIVDQNTAMEVYTYQGTVKKVGAHDFITGTLLLHHTKDNKYPGIVYVTVGGGKNHFGYITITDGALRVIQAFDESYGIDSGTTEYTEDKDLIAAAKKAYQMSNRIGYSVWEPKTTENPYAIREITDDRVTAGKKNQTYRDSFISLSFPLGWKCLEQQGEDGRFLYFQNPVLGEKCGLSIYLSGAIYAYEYTREDYMAHLTGYYGYEDVVIDSFAKETIQGFPCTKVVYSYTEDNTRFVGTQYDDLIEEPRLYHFTITYPAAESKTYEKEFAAIIESLRFVADISHLPLEEAYDYAYRHYMAGPSSQYRDVGKLQPETQQIVEISGKYYQSYVASNVDIRYIWISRSEFPDNKTALWDWYTVGSSRVYSLDLLGKIDEGRSGNETDKIDPSDMLLFSVLYNNQSFYSQSRQKNITISTYQNTISGFTVVDMDADGKNELAVSLNDGNILLLRQAGGAVYGYDFGHRSMNQLYKDGVFSWTENAGNTYGLATLRFTDSDVQITQLWKVEQDGFGNYKYFIDDKPVSEAQVNAIRQRYNWEYVKWSDYGK